MSDPLWSQTNLHNPHAAADKAARVRSMFAAIAPSYDLNNRLHSLWRDQAWRRAAVKAALVKPDDVVLDVACGTGDLALAMAKGGARRVVGVDFTFDMLAVAKKKACGAGGAAGKSKEPLTREACASLPSPRSEQRGEGRGVAFAAGDAMRLPLADRSVDVVSIAFGIRNVSDPGLALAEFARVLRPGGRLVILEFSLPTNRVLRAMYLFYFNQIMPRTAALVARDKVGAYRYLPRSVSTFIDRGTMLELLRSAGFAEVTCQPLTVGIAVIYRAVKGG